MSAEIYCKSTEIYPNSIKIYCTHRSIPDLGWKQLNQKGCHGAIGHRYKNDHAPNQKNEFPLE